MNHKERIDAVLAFQPVDRTPFCLVDGGAWIAKTENLSYRQLYSLEDGGASKIVKWTDEVDTGCDMGAATPALNVKMLGKACKDSSVVNRFFSGNAKGGRPNRLF